MNKNLKNETKNLKKLKKWKTEKWIKTNYEKKIWKNNNKNWKYAKKILNNQM